MRTRFYLGLDLGQASDFTALAIGEKIEPSPDRPRDEYTLRLVHLHRWPLGTSYVSMAEELAAALSMPPLWKNCALAIDETGVGRGVADLFDRLRVDIQRVTIVAGVQQTKVDRSFHVPKKDLIGLLLVLLEQRRLEIVRSLPEASTLIGELSNYRQRRSPTGYQSFSAREGEHDDLVLATSLSAWAVDYVGVMPMAWKTSVR